MAFRFETFISGSKVGVLGWKVTLISLLLCLVPATNTSALSAFVKGTMQSSWIRRTERGERLPPSHSHAPPTTPHDPSHDGSSPPPSNPSHLRASPSCRKNAPSTKPQTSDYPTKSLLW